MIERAAPAAWPSAGHPAAWWCRCEAGGEGREDLAASRPRSVSTPVTCVVRMTPDETARDRRVLHAHGRGGQAGEQVGGPHGELRRGLFMELDTHGEAR